MAMQSKNGSVAEKMKRQSINGNFYELVPAVRDSDGKFPVQLRIVLSPIPLLTVLCVLFACTTAIVLILLLYREGNEENDTSIRTCFTPGCISEAEFLLQNIDRTVNPCADFYKFTCGNFRAAVQKPDGYPFYDWDMITSEGFGKKIVTMIDKQSDQDYPILAYKSCLSHFENVSRFDRTRHLVRSVVDSNTDPMRLAFLLKRDYLLKGLFTVRVGEGSDLPFGPPAIVNILTHLPNFDPSHWSANFDAVSEHFYNGSTTPTRKKVDRDRKAFVDFVQKLSQISINQYATRTFFMPFSKLQTDLTNHSIAEGLEQLSNNTISKSTLVHFQYSLFYVDGLLARFPVAARRYLAISLVKHFTATVEVPDESIDNENLFTHSFPLSAAHFCMKFITTGPIGHLVGHTLLSNNLTLPIEERMHIRTILDDLKSSFKKDVFQHFSHIDPHSMVGIMEDINSVRAVVGYPLWMVSPGYNETFHNYFKRFNFTVDDFVSMYKNSWQFFWRKQFASKTLDEINPPPAHFGTNAHFQRAKGVELQWGLLQRPLYDPRMPIISKYASLGFVLGHELTHLISYYKTVLRSPDGGPFLHQQSKCFENSYSKFCFNNSLSAVPNEQTCLNASTKLEENIADVEGLRLAAEAVTNVIKTRRLANFRLPGLEDYGAIQLFFLSYATRQCSIGEDAYFMHKLTDDIDTHSPDSVRVNGAVINNQFFAQSFNCLPTDKMNPKLKCNLFPAHIV